MLSQEPPKNRLAIDDITADSLKAIRESNAMSQLDFAKRLGLSERAYGNYERGTRSLPQEIRCSMLEHYGGDPVSTAALLDLIERSAKARTGPPPLKWSAVMIRKRRIENGKQASEAGRDCVEVAAS